MFFVSSFQLLFCNGLGWTSSCLPNCSTSWTCGFVFFFNKFWKNLIVISSGNAFNPFPSVLWFSDYRYVNLGFLCCFPFLSWCFYLSGYFLDVASGSFLSPAIHGRLFIYIEQKIYIEYFHTSGCILNYKMSFWFILHWNSLVVQFIKLD